MKILNKGIGVVGSTTIDKIVAGDQSYLKLGGVTTYAGITYRRHGIPAFIVSNLAERDVKVIKNLKTEKIEVRRPKGWQQIGDCNLRTLFPEYECDRINRSW